MSMNPGYMRTPLAIYNPTDSVDEFGQVTSTKTTSTGTIFAAINEASAEEKSNHRQLNQTVTHRIRCRWHPDITHRTQLRTVATEQGKAITTWEVVTAIDWQERRQYLDLVCKQVIT